MSDYSWVGPLISGIAKGVNSYATGDKANQQMQAAYDEMLANLRERFGDYDALGDAGYKDINPQTLGPSALEGIQNDPAARQAQLEAMAALGELADSGGLNLADMKALNDVQGNLNRNNMARQQGLANDFAARGQLGSGAQLAMAMQGQQNAMQNANAAGESAAAQAQARALQAILQKGNMGRGMANDKYSRDAEAARARDAIEARNAAARTQAAMANNSIAGQRFEDNLAKARGKTSLTNSMNQAVFGKGEANKNTTKAFGETTNNLIDQGASLYGQFGGSGETTNPDSPTDGFEDGYGEDDEINYGDDD